MVEELQRGLIYTSVAARLLVQPLSWEISRRSLSLSLLLHPNTGHGHQSICVDLYLLLWC